MSWRHHMRSVVFLVVIASSVVVIGPVVALMWPFPFRVANAITIGWCRFFVWASTTIGGVGCRVQGLDNVPDRPCVFFAKHQSAWETLAFESLLPDYVWILKREALWIPFFGWGLSALKPIAIDRRARGQAVRQIVAQGTARLAEGLSVMIFPEGTRVPAGQTRRFGMGGAVLAVAGGVQVVPIAHNAGSFWPGRRLLLARPGVIDVVIGPPIDTTGRTPDEVNACAKEWIDHTVAHLEAGLLPAAQQSRRSPDCHAIDI